MFSPRLNDPKRSGHEEITTLEDNIIQQLNGIGVLDAIRLLNRIEFVIQKESIINIRTPNDGLY